MYTESLRSEMSAVRPPGARAEPVLAALGSVAAWQETVGEPSVETPETVRTCESNAAPAGRKGPLLAIARQYGQHYEVARIVQSYERHQAADPSPTSESGANVALRVLSRYNPLPADVVNQLFADIDAGVAAYLDRPPTPQRQKPTHADERLLIATAAAYHVLILCNRPLAVSIAMKFRPNNWVTYEDILSAAMEGVADAVCRYDPRQRIAFATFAQMPIRKPIFELFRAQGYATSLNNESRLAAKQYRQAVAEFTEEHDRSPTIEQIAARMDVTPARALELARLVGLLEQQSIEDMAHMPSIDSTESAIPDPRSEEPFARMEARNDFLQALHAAQLTPLQFRVIMARLANPDAKPSVLSAAVGVSVKRMLFADALACAKIRAAVERRLIPVTDIPSSPRKRRIQD